CGFISFTFPMRREGIRPSPGSAYSLPWKRHASWTVGMASSGYSGSNSKFLKAFLCPGKGFPPFKLLLRRSWRCEVSRYSYKVKDELVQAPRRLHCGISIVQILKTPHDERP